MSMNDFLAGDYLMQDVVICGQLLPKVSVRNLMMELNIYESIHTPYMSGNLIIRDTMNHRSNMSMTGQEEIEFTLATNDKSERIDFTKFRGRIYKISDIIPTSAYEQVYTLHFVSMDAIRNTQTRVKSSHKGSPDQITNKILKNILKTEKNFFVEPSSSFTHLLGNNRYPFEYMRMLANRSVSREHKSSGYLFFENHRGYNFCSRDRLYYESANIPRESVDEFFTANQRPRVDTPTEMRTLLSYKIMTTQDTLRDNTNGLLNNTHYSYNRTDKSFSKNVSSYATYINNKTSKSGSPLYTETPEKNSDRLFDFPDATITVSSKDPYLHISSATDEKDYSNAGVSYPDRLRNKSSYGIRVKIELHGNSNIAAGDMITLNIPSHEPIANAQDEIYDVFLTGQYLVENLVHKVDNNRYITVAECTRNNVSTRYEDNKSSIKDNIKNKASTPNAVIDRL